MKCDRCGAIIRPKNYYENKVCELLGLKPDGFDVKKKPYWILNTKERLIEIVEKLEKLTRRQNEHKNID